MRKILIVAMLFAIMVGCAGARRQNYVDQNTWLDADDRQKILEGRIWVGMTKEQLFASWGYPLRQGSTTFSRWYKYSSGYVYTKGGLVAYWQLNY